MEGVPDLDDVLHQLGGFGGVHTGGGLIQQQQGGVGGQSPDDLQTALGAVGQGTGFVVGQVLHAEDGQQLQGALVGQLLLLPVLGQAEDAVPHGVADLVVEADLHVVLHRQVVEQADVLEGTGDARLVHLGGGHAVGVLAVEEDGAPGGMVHLGQQVENRGLARAVGADEAGDLGGTYGDVELVDGGEAAEVDAQVLALQHRHLAQVPFGNDGVAGHRHHLGLFKLFCHQRSPPFRLNRPRSF